MVVRDGSFFTDHVKNKWDANTSNLCRWCGVPDAKLHRYTECSHYDMVRSKHLQLFESWDEFPSCFQLSGLVPRNPWEPLLWEALNALPDLQEDFQFDPIGTTWHAFTDGTCSDPQTKQISLAAWAVVISGMGVLASGPLVGVHQCILRAEITAVISALKWIRGRQGSLHLWCDNEIVVSHFREICSNTKRKLPTSIIVICGVRFDVRLTKPQLKF